MDRRKFFISTGALSGAAMLPHLSWAKPLAERPLIKPKALQKGDTIGLITPGSAMRREVFEKTLANMDMLGFKVKYTTNMNVKKGFLAGTDQQRLSDIHQMFEDPEVDGIFCARGGYGTGRLLRDLNYELIQYNPKVLIGYSDITALHLAIHSMTGLVTFHGPVGASDFSDFTRKAFELSVMKGKSTIAYRRPVEWEKKNESAFESFTINSGSAEGPLVGGNLSLLCSIMGTPYDLSYDGKIVFIEDIGESPYRIDRMITQLINSGKLDNCGGVALGVFYACETKPSDPDFSYSISLRDVLLERFSKLKVPVCHGLPIGHIDDNATLPIGVKASLDADKVELKLLEAGVS